MTNPLTPIRRFLSGDKVLPGKISNLMGLQVARAILARTLYRLRKVEISEDLRKSVAELNNEGLLIWQNFLQANDFDKVREEVLRLRNDLKSKQETLRHGPNTLKIIKCECSEFGDYPAITRFYQDRRLVELMSAVERKPFDPRQGARQYENLQQGIGQEHDPETDMHRDIFYHTHKAWFYLEDVEPANAPLVVVPRSHQMTVLDLVDIYRDSIGLNIGSYRVSIEQSQRYGLQAKEIIVPANTLVIANTHGLHCRRRGLPGKQRHALHWSVRLNPFFSR